MATLGNIKSTSHPSSFKIDACFKIAYIPPEFNKQGLKNPIFLLAIEFI